VTKERVWSANLQSTKGENTQETDLEASPQLQTKKRPERHCQHGHIGSDDDGVVGVVEGDIVDASTPITGCEVERDRVALEESDAKDRDHATCIDGLENVYSNPDLLLDAREPRIESQNRRLDEAQNGVVQQDNEPLIYFGSPLLFQVELRDVPVVNTNIARFHVFSPWLAVLFSPVLWLVCFSAKNATYT
jgi:hypothetical protein